MTDSQTFPQTNPSGERELRRIAEGLRSAGEIFFTSGLDFLSPDKDPVRVASLEHAVDFHLQKFLRGSGEGWLSEESTDDHARLDFRRVWIVDALDGTREFVAGIPEWSVSIGLIEDGLPVAGGVHNPVTGEIFLGTLGNGVTLNGRSAPAREPRCVADTLVLASRSEVRRGKWAHLQSAPFQIRPMGSVAYKLARVAAGLADATWTLVPKHEWDVAAGVALVCAAGGMVKTLDGHFPLFNRPEPLFSGLLAFANTRRWHFKMSHESCAESVTADDWAPGISARLMARW